MSDVLPLPASVESEQAVLGSILLNREAIIAVADTLKADYFYETRHSWIYAAALACYQAQIPPDLRTISEELRRRGQLDQVGGIDYLSDLTDRVPTSYHVGYYAMDVVKTAARRRLISAAFTLTRLAHDESGDISMILAQAHELIDGATVAIHEPRYGAFTADVLDAETLPPLRWAVPNLLPQGLTMLVGKPKMRKSWFALALALAIASGGRALGTIPVEQGDVLYLALEDSKHRLQSRQRKILSGAAAPRRLTYMTAAPRLDQGCVGIVETWLRRHPDARLVIIDVLAKVKPLQSGRGSMYDEDYSAMEPLQQLAVRRDIAVLVIHHMNRSDAEDIYDLVNGSNGIGGSVDGLLALQYDRGQQDAVLKIGSRDLEDDAALALRWDGQTAQWILLGKAEEVKAGQERQEILRVLREEKRPLTPREVADILGKETAREYQSAKMLMYRMSRDGDLNNANGRYTVPALTLLGEPENRKDGSGDRVIDGDRGAITENRVSRSDTGATNGRSFALGDRGDRKNTDEHHATSDHRDHRAGFSGSESESRGDLGPITVDHRDHPTTLEALPPAHRMQLALYLRSNKESDQEIARARCDQWGIDYDAARAQARAAPLGGD